MKEPKIEPDGRCSECGSGWQCAFHSAQGVRRFAEREAMLKQVAIELQLAELDRLCAQHELEGDEFFTAYQKAKMLANRTRLC